MPPVLKAMRPKQWLKNVLVFAAPGAAGVLDDAGDLGLTLVAFVSFCLAASGIYLWNDLKDVEADRIHPTKRHRPFASGSVSIRTGRALGVLLPIASLAVAAATGRWETVVVIAVYIALTLTYTFWLKEVAVIDLLAIASGFVLRAAAGAVAVDVPMSRWFVLCVTFGSLFIVVGKRYAELQEVGVEAGTRATLDTYTPGFLRMLLSASLAGALLSYCVWAFETAEGTDIPLYELSIVPMIAALFRYLLVLERGEGSAPEEVFASDRVLQLAGLIWIIIYGVAVYTA
ncbi:MAG: decaprenyl-phosphate phosphoribosyltransferase [Ilumatobacter sp.]|uniref:decaprenyl-phosphate phosphoribosyltransferase n=2 Tax=Ilumatobacter sp. TaxID=1967498 RepID=UPI0032979184